jgi:hypothetical protein
MAISDVLDEAINDINDYVKETPDAYKEIQPKLKALLRDMASIRDWLDTPLDETKN